MNIIELAKEAGFPTLTDYGNECLERFRNLVIEECAKVCEEKGTVKGGEVFAARIREMKHG